MRVLTLALALAAGCRCSSGPDAATPPSDMVLDLAGAHFSDEDYQRLGLDGAWVTGSGASEVDLRFRVFRGELVVDGPLGDYAGGLVGDLLVLHKSAGGDGSPVESWLNLAPTAGGTLEGKMVQLGAGPADSEAVAFRRR